MKFSTKVPACFLCLFFVSCSIQGNFLTEHKDGWFNNPTNQGLVYCRANVQADGTADPTCYETGFSNFEQQKKNVK
jgi:hypothetical protein